MIYASRKTVIASLAEFAPRLRAAHCIIKLVSGKWTRALGAPGDVIADDGSRLRAVHVRGREYLQIRMGGAL